MAAKRDEENMRHEEQKRNTLADVAATEKSKLKVIEDSKTQVQTQNMIAMLNHPSVVATPTPSERMMSKIMGVMGVSGPNNRQSRETETVNETVNDMPPLEQPSTGDNAEDV